MPARPRHSLLGLLCLLPGLCTSCLTDKRALDTGGVSNAISLAQVCGKGGRECRYLSDTIEDVDLLFVIDNSNSMKEEQLRMPTQFRRLVGALTTGDRDGDGKQDFARVQSLHLGVVSSDMGLPGIDRVELCQGLGDDGILLHSPSTDIKDCKSDYPAFVTATANSTTATATQPADDFSCMATLGIKGCGFEQQLEAGLKALWPKNDPMPMKNGSNRVRFLTTPDGKGEFGHGDTENAGFLRNDPDQSSIIGIVVLSDEDDGSSRDVHHYTPKQFLDPNDSLYLQPLNLRDYYNPDALYGIERYVEGFKALRPETPERVVFGAIVGVPPDLVSPDAVRDLATDAEARKGFYQSLLDDPDMQETLNSESLKEPGQGQLNPSCATFDDVDKPTGKAYPPRRFVKVAQGFGENGFVQSICADEFNPAIDALVERIGAHIDPACLGAEQTRDQQTTLLNACRVLWVLPPAGDGASDNAPACDDIASFVKPAAALRSLLPAAQAGRVCEVEQLPIPPDSEIDRTPKGKSGWYYDDFSKDADLCLRDHGRISFTEGVKPPAGVRVVLDCK